MVTFTFGGKKVNDVLGDNTRVSGEFSKCNRQIRAGSFSCMPHPIHPPTQSWLVTDPGLQITEPILLATACTALISERISIHLREDFVIQDTVTLIVAWKGWHQRSTSREETPVACQGNHTMSPKHTKLACSGCSAVPPHSQTLIGNGSDDSMPFMSKLRISSA